MLRTSGAPCLARQLDYNCEEIRCIRVISVKRREKGQTRSCEQINARTFWRSSRCIGVVLSHCLACLRAENCSVCFATTKRPVQRPVKRPVKRPESSKLSIDSLDNVHNLNTLWTSTSTFTNGILFTRLNSPSDAIRTRYMVCENTLFKHTFDQWN